MMCDYYYLMPYAIFVCPYSDVATSWTSCGGKDCMPPADHERKFCADCGKPVTVHTGSKRVAAHSIGDLSDAINQRLLGIYLDGNRHCWRSNITAKCHGLDIGQSSYGVTDLPSEHTMAAWLTEFEVEFARELVVLINNYGSAPVFGVGIIHESC